jgi:hypothetical protein
MRLIPQFLLSLGSLALAALFLLMPTRRDLPYEELFLNCLCPLLFVSTFALWLGARWARPVVVGAQGALACYFMAYAFYFYRESFPIPTLGAFGFLALAVCPFLSCFATARWGHRFLT